MSEATPSAGGPIAAADLVRLLRGASVTVFSQDDGLKYRWLENAPEAWTVPASTSGFTDADILPSGAAATAVAAKRIVLTTGRPRWTEFTVERNGRRQHFEVYLEAEKDGSGETVGVAGLALDVTERRKRQAALEAIVRQSSHRSKNLLAVLQSLAVQTARGAASTADFIEQYRGRIQSISRSQDLAMGTASHEASLSALIAAQVEPFVAEPATQIRFEGADCDLTTGAALHIGLALAELAVTGAGTRSLGNGTITISAEYAVDAAVDPVRPALKLEWRENGGRGTDLPQGFARQLLERLVPAAIGGEATLGATDDGLFYVLTAAPSEFELLLDRS